MITRVMLVAWLTLVWILLWGEASVGNILAGLIIATVLVPAFRPGDDGDVGLHPIAIAKFGVWFAWALISATASVVRQVLRPTLQLEQGIVAVPLRATSPVVTTFVANAISLTPGTLTVDVRPQSFGQVGIDSSHGDLPVVDGVTQPPVLYVHCLETGDPDQVRADGLVLEEFAVRAFGSAEDRLAIQGPAPRWPRIAGAEITGSEPTGSDAGSDGGPEEQS